MDIYDRIDFILKQKGKTRQQMCDEADVNYGTLNSSFSRRSNKIQYDVLINIAEYLNVSIDYLLGKKTSPTELSEPLDIEHFDLFSQLTEQGKNKATDYIRDILATYAKNNNVQKVQTSYVEEKAKRLLPLYDYPASAGVGIYAGEGDYQLYEVPDDAPSNIDFGVIISGDSMEPKIPDGSIVWVRKQPDVYEGETCIVVINDEGYCKVKGNGVFHSVNKKYKDIKPGISDEVYISGLVAHVQTPDEQY